MECLTLVSARRMKRLLKGPLLHLGYSLAVLQAVIEAMLVLMISSKCTQTSHILWSSGAFESPNDMTFLQPSRRPLRERDHDGCEIGLVWSLENRRASRCMLRERGFCLASACPISTFIGMRKRLNQSPEMLLRNLEASILL